MAHPPDRPLLVLMIIISLTSTGIGFYHLKGYLDLAETLFVRVIRSH